MANTTSPLPLLHPTADEHEMGDNLQRLYTGFMIIVAGVVPFCAIVTFGAGCVVWLKCRDFRREKRRRAESVRVWYGRDKQSRLWRNMAISEPDLGPNFAKTLSDGHRSWLELGSVEDGLEGKM